MRDKLLIIGASGHGKVTADIALKMNKWKSIAFLDDDDNINQIQMNIRVMGKSNEAYKYIKDCDIFIAIGNNNIRKKFQERLEAEGASIPVLIHPASIIGKEVELGIGTVVMAGTVINCCTKIGKGCIINTGSTIDHDNFIQSYVHISPGAHLAGGVKVGNLSWIGIGSSIIQGINVGKGSIIGAGSVMIRDLPDNCTAVGNPARVIKNIKVD